MAQSRPPIPSVAEIVYLHRMSTQQWHAGPIQCESEGWLSLVCDQHGMNFLLWHEEDQARSPRATDSEIATVKRNIDQLNQQRNDLIERVDDALAEMLRVSGVNPGASTRWHTETPGQAIDRLSIMSLRIFHYEEQLERSDATSDAEFQRVVRARLATCRQQLSDLARALERLLADLFQGEAQLKTYRQFKMYNDPRFNPAIYEQS